VSAGREGGGHRGLWQALIEDLPASADSVQLAAQDREAPLFVPEPS
jgi:hypothetical protein